MFVLVLTGFGDDGIFSDGVRKKSAHVCGLSGVDQLLCVYKADRYFRFGV